MFMYNNIIIYYILRVIFLCETEIRNLLFLISKRFRQPEGTFTIMKRFSVC